MTAQQPKRCHICGAEMSHINPEICENYHVQQARPHTPAPKQKPVENCKGNFNPKTDPCYHCPAVEVCPTEHNELAEGECAINNCMRKDWLQRHDAAIARTATLKAMTELADFLDNADNVSDSGNANKFVPLPKLFKWMMERGWTP
jgi:hypothetical protein